MTALLSDPSGTPGDGATRPVSGPDAEQDGREPTPTRVLIAEDEWIVAAALRRQVQAHGYDVVGTVGTGTEVLALCKEDDPTVVLMDVQMPEMDGLTATRRLMATCPHPVAVITGNTALRQEAEQAGAMEYVVKPVLPHQIPEIIARTQQRFCWFLRLRDNTASSEEALEAWPVVQQAVRHLVKTAHLSEAQAFARIEEAAQAARTSLREAAARLVAAE